MSLGTSDPGLGDRFFEPEPSKPCIDGGPRPTDERSPSARDLARVLHSGAFRRLQGKSQVVRSGNADYFRTRLTHTLEVAQIGRAIATNLGYHDATLVEVACMIHDLGHPPFGHNGELALKEWMHKKGSFFEGNPQSFRIVTNLEVKHPPSQTGGRRVGLNLRLETLWASLKYPWPQAPEHVDEAKHRKFGWYGEPIDSEVAERICSAVAAQTPDYRSTSLAPIPKHPAAAIMDWADDIAYSVHDLEDGVRAGLIPLHHLVGPDSQAERDVVVKTAIERGYLACSAEAGRATLDNLLASDPIKWCRRPYQHTDDERGRLRQMTSALIESFAFGMRPIVTRGQLTRASDLGTADGAKDQIGLLKAMTWHYIIQAPGLQTLRYRERRILTDLCDALFEEGVDLLPEERQSEFMRACEADCQGSEATQHGRHSNQDQCLSWVEDPGATPLQRHRARVVCDYVAGMTDNFADKMYERLLGNASGQYVTDLL